MVSKRRIVVLIFGVFLSVILLFNAGLSATNNPINAWAVLTGHSEAVSSVVFSPDGKTIASGSVDKTIKIWNIPGGRLRATLTGHSGAVNSVVFSPDGKIIASGSRDKTIKIWNVANGKLLATLSGHSDSVNSVTFSPDGNTIASGCRDRSIKLWDVANRSLRTTLTGHSDEILSIAFSPDGKSLASGSCDKKAKIWNIPGGTLRATTTGNTSWVYSVAFSPDSKTLVFGGVNNQIRIWDLAKGEQSSLLFRSLRELFKDSEDVDDEVGSIAISPDGKIIASGNLLTATIDIWDVAGKKLLTTLNGHADGLYVSSVTFSPDGKTLASGGADKSIKLWNVPTATKPLSSLMPALTPIPSGQTMKLVFEETDKFSSHRGITRFRGGTEGSTYWNTPEWVPINFTAKVLVKWDGGIDNRGFGIMFRINSVNDFYVFQIAPSGHYCLMKQVNTQWEYPVDWMKTDLLKPGNKLNGLQVHCQDNSINCYLNGVQVISIQDNPPSRKTTLIGIIASGGVKCSFSNFEVNTN